MTAALPLLYVLAQLPLLSERPRKDAFLHCQKSDWHSSARGCREIWCTLSCPYRGVISLPKSTRFSAWEETQSLKRGSVLRLAFLVGQSLEFMLSWTGHLVAFGVNCEIWGYVIGWGVIASSSQRKLNAL